MVENISSSNSTKVWDQARMKLMASGSIIGLTTDCCKHDGLKDALNLPQLKVYRSYGKGLDGTTYIGDHNIFLHAKYVSCLPSWHVY